jgi:hypothetical protein
MAHFAWLDNNNIVYQVSVVNNSDIQDLPFPESEAVGITYLTSVHGSGKTWKQTSFNANFRGSYAGIGFTYDAINDVFVAPTIESEVVDDVE